MGKALVLGRPKSLVLPGRNCGSVALGAMLVAVAGGVVVTGAAGLVDAGYPLVEEVIVFVPDV